MNQSSKVSQDYQNTQQQFICPLQIIKLLKKLETIDQNKRITRISKKGQRNKVIIGRRNAISRISMKVQRQLEIFQISKQIEQQTNRQVCIYYNIKKSAILSDFFLIQKFFQQKFQFRLLYRATQNNFSIQSFHKLCDGFPNTLVLCRTQTQNIIGGYTPLTWDSQYEVSQTYFKSDHKNQTFLFSITEEEKYPIKKSQRNKAICCYEKYGPTFGGGYDLCIGNNSANESSTFSYFPRNFQCPQQIREQKRNQKFTGCRKKYFKLKQWEVFQLKFKQKQPVLEQPRRIKIFKNQSKQKRSSKTTRLQELKNIFKKMFRFKSKSK